MNDNFIYLYLSNDIIRNYECFQAGSKRALSANAFMALLLAAYKSAWCADCFDIKDYNKFTNTAEHSKYIKNTLNLNDRNYADAIRLLVKNNLMYKVKKDMYLINPWIASHGDTEEIRKYRQYCFENNIFGTPNLQGRAVTTAEEQKILNAELTKDVAKQKHVCVYIDNIANFSCFTGEFDEKRLNITELILFFLFATYSKFVKFPNSIVLNNVIDNSTQELEKIAEMLQLKKRAVQYAIQHLTEVNLLHKIESEHGKYIVNPFLTAKGKKEVIKAFQVSLFKSGSYFNNFSTGDLMYDNNLIINLKTGETKVDLR